MIYLKDFTFPDGDAEAQFFLRGNYNRIKLFGDIMLM